MDITNAENQSLTTENNFENSENKCSKQHLCPVKDVLASIGDKWSLQVVLCLGDFGRSRFSYLKKEISGISQRMLTVTLRSLEQDGYISRTLYPQVPPRVEYELTKLGESLKEQLRVLAKWANENSHEVAEARQKFGMQKDELHLS